MTVITRFAPSPTGYLHVGGARTALFSWLYAKKTKGEFVLRIEDTDRERSSEASVQAILDGMSWLGLDHDRGPIFQTDRFDRYEQVIQQLLDEGKAYRCYHSQQELDDMREQQKAKGDNPRYDGSCRNLSAYPEDKPHVIRFKNPLDASVVIDDLIRGHIEISNTELDDLIIARTDGTPTYNFTVVVDDLDMGITHVIRGDDHINNTPKQINILHALNAPIPKYAHVPMILGDDGKRLSKRHGAVGVMQYRDDGYLPQALLNYLVRLGWSNGDREIFSVDEMIDLFSLEAINKTPSAFNTKKLNWLNQHYMKTLPASEVAVHLNWHLVEQGINATNNAKKSAVIEALIPLYAERTETLKQLASQIRFMFEDFKEFDVKAAKKHLKITAGEALSTLKVSFESLVDWNEASIQNAIDETMTKLDIGMGKIGMPLRVAITGSGQSPGMDILCALLGKEATLARLDKALSFIEQRKLQAEQR
ncbi:MAG: glutamate--tRNA ligase [Gammaproteobacteria bacterium]|nr:MAG: glutamate--tRNA ligase [Gammaproteobacteria bacterium]